MRYLKLKLGNQVSFKKRYHPGLKIKKLRWGSIGIRLLSNLKFEHSYVLLFKKYFKRVIRRTKYKNLKKWRAWVFIKYNQPISKKSKNSRMGKGKGSFLRWCAKLKTGHILIETKRVRIYKFINYKKKIEKLTNASLKIFKNCRFWFVY